MKVTAALPAPALVRHAQPQPRSDQTFSSIFSATDRGDSRAYGFSEGGVFGHGAPLSCGSQTNMTSSSDLDEEKLSAVDPLPSPYPIDLGVAGASRPAILNDPSIQDNAEPLELKAAATTETIVSATSQDAVPPVPSTPLSVSSDEQAVSKLPPSNQSERWETLHSGGAQVHLDEIGEALNIGIVVPAADAETALAITRRVDAILHAQGFRLSNLHINGRGRGSFDQFEETGYGG